MTNIGMTSADESTSSRLDEQLRRRLQALRDRGEGAFMPFVVIGDPDLETSMACAEALCEGGADIMEFGFPFSDPPADGPTIQAADQRALAAGTTPSDCLAFIAEFRRRRDVPVALLIYYNLVLQRGVDRFYREAAAAGVNAVLVADVPLEHSGPIRRAAEAAGIAPIFIATALSSDERLEQLAAVAGGYIYAVARIGITGEQTSVDRGLAETLERIRAKTPLPVLAGFGISSPENARTVFGMGADGAICGSAIVRQVQAFAEGRIDRDSLLSGLRSFARSMKSALAPQ